MKVAVTGASGFLASHIALRLINDGYLVRGTLRSPSREMPLRAALANAGAQVGDSFETAIANLNSDDGWLDAFEGCDYVMHVASPFPAGTSSEEELLKPAVEGTRRVLRAARDASVRRVVVTSSFGAIGYGHPDGHPRFTEQTWTDITAPDVTAYIKSKTLGEQAAWDFLEEEAGGLEICSVNPTGIFGPTLSSDVSSSLLIVKQLLDGSVPMVPKLYFGVVDVRDVADLQIRVMRHAQAAGERFIGVAGDNVSMYDVAQILRRKLGQNARRVPGFEAPNWLFRGIARFTPAARAIVPQLGKQRQASNEKAMELLNWRPRSIEETIVATAESLLSFGIVESGDG